MPSRSSKKRKTPTDASGGPSKRGTGPLRAGSPAASGRGAARLRVPGLTGRLEEIRAFVSGIARRSGFVEEEVNKIELAVDEACSNVIEHAYGEERPGDIDVSVRADRDRLTVTVSDNGKSFRFDGVPVPDMKQYLSELRVGGLGIYLMRMLMDDVTYRSRAGRNELRMVKYRGGGNPARKKD
ncbi:ATP-binding protein [bacterium]|nr:ATP-binding protein [bacterium]